MSMFDEVVELLNKLKDNYDSRVVEHCSTAIYKEIRPFVSLHLLERCESPIEQLLFISLASKLDYYSGLFGAALGLTVGLQQEIKTELKTYRVDFLVTWDESEYKPDDPLADEFGMVTTTYSQIVVECDGHDFHERTKEQAQRDKARDRALQAAGYTVLRYTGSEIWKDPDGCAREVYRLVGEQARQKGRVIKDR